MPKEYFDKNMERIVTVRNLKTDYNWIKKNGIYENAHGRPLPSFNEWIAECIAEGRLEEIGEGD